MKLRRNMFPSNLPDFIACSFLFLMIQLGYWFEVFIVLPDYYSDCTVLYACHFVLSTYLLINLVGNLVAAFMIDSSIAGEMMPSTLKASWRFCDVCESVTPPRSWHCSVCKICILKRDHHCNFTACCIGHRNHRYFILFLFYLMVSTAYCTYFNLIYLWSTFSSLNLMSFLKIFFPVAIFITGIDNSLEQYYRLIIVITVVGLTAAVALFMYHMDNIMKGRVMYEKMKEVTNYDMGNALSNLKMVIGNRWYLAILSPFVKSELPHDGIHWEPASSKND